MKALPRGVALFLAAVVIVVTGVYSAGWIYYTGLVPATRLGVSFDHRPGSADMLVTAVEPGAPAARAGVEPGDRILDIDDRRLETPNPFYDAISRGRPGDIVKLGLDRGGQSITVRATLESRPSQAPGSPARSIVSSLLRLYPVEFFIVAAVVLLQRPQDRVAWLLAFLFITLIAGAPVEEELIHPAFRSFAYGFNVLGGALPAALYCFFAVFPVQSPIDRRVPWLKHVLLVTALAGVTVLGGLAMRAGSLAPVRGIGETGFWGLARPLLGGYFVLGIALGLGSLVLNYLRAPDAESRRRTRVLAWGMVVGLTPISVLQTAAGIWDFDPYYHAPFWIWASSVLALFLIPLSFAYAVVRYRVLEIPVLLRRSARYLLVQRGFIALLFLLSAGATIALAVELPLLLPARAEGALPVGLIAGAGFGVALAWGGARLHHRFTERIDRAFFRNAYDARRILEDLAARAGRAASREELAEVLEGSTRAALHPKSLTVYLERNGDSLETFSGAPPAELHRLPRRLPELAAIAAEGGPVIPRPDTDGGHVLPALGPLGAECFSPMFARDGRMAGLLALGPRMSEEPYSSEDRRLLSAVCNQAGLALDSISLAEQIAERMEAERRATHELEIAQEVQRRLLPQQPPALRTLECAGACLQARAVGGDYYDFLDLGDGLLGLVLADISGKGIAAALLMANLQAYVRSRFALVRDDLLELLGSLNRYLFDSSPSSRYATLFFGRYDDASRRLVYVNCGHNPPLLLRGDGTSEWLAPTGPVVGLFDEWKADVGELTLRQGDTLVLYTDGVTDARDDDGEFFGEEPLQELLLKHRREPAGVLLETVIETVTHFSGSVQEDDLTVVVARGV